MSSTTDLHQKAPTAAERSIRSTMKEAGMFVEFVFVLALPETLLLQSWLFDDVNQSARVKPSSCQVTFSKVPDISPKMFVPGFPGKLEIRSYRKGLVKLPSSFAIGKVCLLVIPCPSTVPKMI